MSPPAQKARPAPVTTTTATSGSASHWVSVSMDFASSSGLSAFSRSGRFRVRVAMWPSMEVRITSSGIGYLAYRDRGLSREVDVATLRVGGDQSHTDLVSNIHAVF